MLCADGLVRAGGAHKYLREAGDQNLHVSFPVLCTESKRAGGGGGGGGGGRRTENS